MSEYASVITLAVNGQTIEDFKSAQEKEIEINKAVNLMNKTGVMSMTPRYGIEVEYVVPKTGHFDWREVKDGTLVISVEGGQTITYSGVSVLKIGQAKYDGENEVTQTIDLVATGRNEG